MFLSPAWKGESSLLWCCHLCFGIGTGQICVRDLALSSLTHWWLRQGNTGISRSFPGPLLEEKVPLEIVLDHYKLFLNSNTYSSGKGVIAAVQHFKYTIALSPSFYFSLLVCTQQIHHNTINQTVQVGNKWKWHPMYPSGFLQVTSGQIPYRVSTPPLLCCLSQLSECCTLEIFKSSVV